MSVFEQILLKVEKPARYVGGEFNLPNLNKPDIKAKFCLAFPDVYEVGMSNLGMQILYSVLNSREDTICERCFAPWKDMGKLLKENDLPLMSVETKKPLKDFDVIGFSIQYELSYTNVAYMLDLAKIPLYAKDRGEEYPLIVGGGPCVANPEPFADFFDIICIGDGEDFINELASLIAEHKGTKEELLKRAKSIQGAYVPMFTYGKNEVKKAAAKDLNKTGYPLKPLVPNIEIVHDRPIIELFRGCFAGCRFCQACFYYRPIRFRSLETVKSYAQSLITATGAEELGFSSLSSGDYPYIKEAIKDVSGLAAAKNVKLQLPSLRLDSYDKEITEHARRSSLTFAPEAGTQRLRDVINKNITEEDIETTVRTAFMSGYRSVKLYFMVGLPTETDIDLEGIALIVRKIKKIYYEVNHNNSLTVTVSTSIFVPKSVTPFQWCAQIDLTEMIRRQRYVRELLRAIKGVNYSWHEETTSYLEGIFARGDRKLSKLVEIAYKNGACFDGWSKEFNYEVWQKSIEESGIDVTKYVAEWDLNADLPWDIIDFGVKKEYLKNEYLKAKEGVATKDCKLECRNCGANAYAKCKV